MSSKIYTINGRRLKCDICENVEIPPYENGDTCYCGGHFKFFHDDKNPEVGDWVAYRCFYMGYQPMDWVTAIWGNDHIKNGNFIEAVIVLERAADVKRRLKEEKA